MANSFGDAFKSRVEHKAGKDLSRYKLSDLFPPTTEAVDGPFTGREDTAGDKLAKAIRDQQQKESNGNQ